MQKITSTKDPFEKPKSNLGGIRRGDISRWAKGNPRFQYPEPKNSKPEFRPVTSLNACVLNPAKPREKRAKTVMIAAVIGHGADSPQRDIWAVVSMSSRMAEALAKLGRTNK